MGRFEALGRRPRRSMFMALSPNKSCPRPGAAQGAEHKLDQGILVRKRRKCYSSSEKLSLRAMPLSLPPLNALRAFEAAARTGSYVAAAEGLDVSPAAVRQHVRHLEEFLGRQLFRRLNNRVLLTDGGQVLFAGASDALQPA